MFISYLESYNYTDRLYEPSNPNPFPPRTLTTWYVEMKERHYKDVRQRELELG